ncbi:hypothetical protein LG3211_4533 [Lysobacter gummosus]|nr:hypothetical protein LG3211_4533 [Lysobacter gummosus]
MHAGDNGQGGARRLPRIADGKSAAAGTRGRRAAGRRTSARC